MMPRKLELCGQKSWHDGPLQAKLNRWMTKQRPIAQQLLLKTFKGLNLQEAYDVGFYGNVATTDALGVLPTYLGTDQRDDIVQFLEDIFRKTRANSRILDVGAGDGQTFSLAADSLSHASLTLLEPSKAATDRYERMIAEHPHLDHDGTINAGLEDIETICERGPFDLVLSIHSIYYVETETALLDMYSLLCDGGSLAVVYAPSAASAHQALLYYLETTGRQSLQELHQHRLSTRDHLLSNDDISGVVRLLNARFPGSQASITVQNVPSRFYAHQLWNLAEMCLMGDLCYVDQQAHDTIDPAKLTAALDMLCEKPHLCDLRVEDSGVRKGMLSVIEPQRMVVISKQRLT